MEEQKMFFDFLTGTSNNRPPGWKHCRNCEAKRINSGNNPVNKQVKLQASTIYKVTTFFADILSLSI